MLALSYTAAVTAAGLNASSSVAQRLATQTPLVGRLFRLKFVLEILRKRLFLFGFVLQVAAFLAQATALKNGPLIVVEPLLTSDLIFLLLLIRWQAGIVMKSREWISVAAIIVGLSGLFYVLHPQRGTLNYSLESWMILISVMGTLIITTAVIIRQLKSQTARAILAGIAAASAYALNASLTKLVLNIFTQTGFLSIFTSWALYAFLVSGIVSIYLMINAYGSGPLAITQPIMEVFEPAIAVIIGVTIFSESFSTSKFALVVGMFCVMTLIAGIVSLASSPKINQAAAIGI